MAPSAGLWFLYGLSSSSTRGHIKMLTCEKNSKQQLLWLLFLWLLLLLLLLLLSLLPLLPRSFNRDRLPIQCCFLLLLLLISLLLLKFSCVLLAFHFWARDLDSICGDRFVTAQSCCRFQEKTTKKQTVFAVVIVLYSRRYCPHSIWFWFAKFYEVPLFLASVIFGSWQVWPPEFAFLQASWQRPFPEIRNIAWSCLTPRMSIFNPPPRLQHTKLYVWQRRIYF